MACIEYPDDIVTGETYLTWGGMRVLVLSVSGGLVRWRDTDGIETETSFRSFASRVRKVAEPRNR